MAKLYLTYDAAKPLSTLAVWSRKGDASVCAKENGRTFEEHDVEMKREGVASWVSNELLPWLANSDPLDGDLRDIPDAGAPSPEPASSDNSETSANSDEPDERTIAVSGPPADDDDDASDLEAMEPAGPHDDPDPPTTADEELAGQGVSAAERVQQSLDKQGAGERPPEAQQTAGTEEDDPAAGLGDIL